MPPESVADNTGIAVAVGRLEVGMQHALEGINEIKTTVTDVQSRVGVVETIAATTVTRVNAIEGQTARKPPWTAIGAFMVGGVSLLYQFITPQ